MVVILSPCRQREGEAGVHAPAVNVHRARAALAVVAALLGARQVDGLAQGVEQRGTRVDSWTAASCR